MTVRKLAMSPCHIESLNLKRETLRILKEAGVSTQELIVKARNDTVWQTYYPSGTSQANQLRQYAGIGEVRAKEIVKAVDEAGFILHESEESRRARQLLVHALRTPSILLEHYEELEDMTPEALRVVDKLICDTLPNERTQQILRLRYGFEDGEFHTLQECGKIFDITTERAMRIEARALQELRRRHCLKKLEVATCYSRKSLAHQMETLRSDIDRLQQELDILQSGNPYPELANGVGFMLIEDLDFSVRTFNCLKRSGIHTVFELCGYTKNDLLNIRNLRAVDVKEVCEHLEDMGLTLAPNLPT